MNSSEYLEQHAELLAEKWLPQSDNKEAIQAWMQLLDLGQIAIVLYDSVIITTCYYKMSVQLVSKNSAALLDIIYLIDI